MVTVLALWQDVGLGCSPPGGFGGLVPCFRWGVGLGLFSFVRLGLGCWLKFDKTKGFEGEGPDAGKHQRKDLEVLTINANCAKTSGRQWRT